MFNHHLSTVDWNRLTDKKKALAFQFRKVKCFIICNFGVVNYQISDWNQLKKELVSWNTVLDRPSVKKVRELVLA